MSRFWIRAPFRFELPTFRLCAGLALFGGVVVVGLWLAVIGHLSNLKGQLIENARRDTTNLALALEEHIVCTLQGVDSTSVNFKTELEKTVDVPFGLGDGPTLTRSAPETATQLGVIDTPAGIAALSLNPTVLTDFYRKVDAGQHGAIAILDEDGAARAQRTGGIEAATSVPNFDLLEKAQHTPSGSYVGNGVLDEVERVFSYRTVAGYPLIVVVGFAVDDVLGVYRPAARATLAASGIITVFVAAVVFLFTRQTAVLEETVQHLAHNRSELIISKNAAEAANTAKSQFLAGMSHELRTPLNAVIGFSEMIRNDALSLNASPKYREYAGHIYDSGQHLLHLIDDVLDMSKIEMGHLEIHSEDVDLAEVVPHSMKMVADRARAARVSLIRDLAPGLPLLVADRTHLIQIILNLLTNAIKFTPPPGDVTVAARLTPTGSMLLEVADTGIGMTSEEIQLALQPFRQVDNRLARENQGTGLGLPIVKSLAELHDAEFVVESAPHQGTTIRITFPISRVRRTNSVPSELLDTQPAAVRMHTPL